MRSADLIEKNINLLAEAFPNIVTEVKNNGGEDQKNCRF